MGELGEFEGVAAGEVLGIYAENSRSDGSVQIEATGVVTWLNADGNDFYSCQFLVIKGEDFAAFLGIEVVVNRQRRFADEGKSAGAGVPLSGLIEGFLSKGIDRDDDKNARGEHPNDGEALPLASGSISPAEFSERL